MYKLVSVFKSHGIHVRYQHFINILCGGGFADFQALVMTALMAVAAASPLGFGLGAPLVSKVSPLTISDNFNNGV